MTIKQRVILVLKNQLKGIDDDELARVLNLSSRQQANSRCRELEKEGLVVRRQVDGRIHNFWVGNDEAALSSAQPNTVSYRSDRSMTGHWFWEGNVQAKVISFLVAQGYQIRFAADTASRQQGIDIVAENERKALWVSVKGYPQGTVKTNPSVQAGHWFKHAVFDIVEYRGRDANVLLAIALPDYPRYHSMAQKISWLRPVAEFSYF